MNRDERGPWYLLTGLVLGAILGLVYAWWVQPVRYTNTTPASLRTEFKDRYRVLIAAAYLGNSDLVRARARLDLLQDADPFRALSGQAQRTLAENGEAAEARALGLLAIALGQAAPGPAVAITQERATPPLAPATVQAAQLETPPGEPPEITAAVAAMQAAAEITATAAISTPASGILEATPLDLTAIPTTGAPAALATEAPAQASATLMPTSLPLSSATPGGPFLLLSRDKLCEQALDAPLIQVQALDRFNAPMPGTLVIVAWQGSEERFYTGLKPEKGPGYADFSPTPGVLYTLRLGENGQPEDNLAALVCIGPGGERYWGAWLLKFVQP